MCTAQPAEMGTSLQAVFLEENAADVTINILETALVIALRFTEKKHLSQHQIEYDGQMVLVVYYFNLYSLLKGA